MWIRGGSEASGRSLRTLLGPSLQVEADGLAPCLLPPGAFLEPAWLEGNGYQVVWDPKAVTTGDKMLPRPAGHALGAGKERHLVYDI